MHHDAQRRTERLLATLVESGRERGCQVAAYRDGELVVDAWAGASGDPVDGSTLFPVFSVSKGLVATVVHALVERGVFEYDTRIAEVWPDFGAQGKSGVTLTHLLEHSAGVPYFPLGLSAEDLLDQPRITALIAALPPEWPAGEKTGYHSLTFGYIVAELVLRATGRTLDAVLAETLTVPLGLDKDLFLVVPDDQLHRLADIDGEDFGRLMHQLPTDSPFYRAIGGIDVESIVPRQTAPTGRTWRADAPLPFGATMTARAGAALYGALAGGDGELLPAARIATATAIRRRDVDQILGVPALKSLGYVNADGVSGGLESAFGFGGLGGAEAYADPAHRFSFAFTHNLLTPPTRPDSAPELAAEIRAALGI